MEEIPEIVESQDSYELAKPTPAVVPEKLLEMLLGQGGGERLQDIPETVIPLDKKTYDLEISPGMVASVEVPSDQRETDFDRRHEVKGQLPPEPAQSHLQPMVPISKVLQSRVPQQNQQVNSTPSHTKTPAPKKQTPTYQQALRKGIALGIVIGVTTVALYIILR